MHASRRPAWRRDVLNQLDRFRARSLGERLTQDRGPQSRDDTRGLRERLNWLYRRVQRLQDDGEPSAALADELRRTERELLERARRSRIAAPARRSRQARRRSLHCRWPAGPAGR